MSLLDFGLTLLLDEADEPVGGGVVGGHRVAAVQLRLDFLSQLLSQLHPAEGEGESGKDAPSTGQPEGNPCPQLSRPTHPHWSKLLMSQMTP